MKKNRLFDQSSPYLLQHKNNPVWWMPWGEEAFELAQKEDKPILLSVGYSTCHWCHVMEKDSFEKQDVADVLNAHFIAVKVDREERPDVDSLFMSAVQAMTGHGGWPMTVFLTPQGAPFWGGTFIPHDQFIQILAKAGELWQQDRKQIGMAAEKLTEFLQESSKSSPTRLDLTTEIFSTFFKAILNRFDSENGGTLGAPKFPQALSLMVMLRIYRRTRNPQALSIVTKTLDQMRRGGIYDQIGGGFHRYSTDATWLVPHFEKMLYDNALLMQTYLQTYLVTKNNEYKQTAIEIAEYILREMTSPEGAFYSAQDADSEGIEGKYFVWSIEEIQSLVDKNEFEAIKNYFNLTTPNFSAHQTGDEVTPKRHDPPALEGHVLFISPGTPLRNDPTLKSAIEKLLVRRSQRIPPHLDDKVLTSWSSLAISSFCQLYAATNIKKYQDVAVRAGQFILKNLLIDGNLRRSIRNQKLGPEGLSEDYAYFIRACIDLYEATFDEAWVLKAIDLQSQMDEIFWDTEDLGYFDNSGQDKNLLVKTKNVEDGVVPSANGMASLNLVRLFHFTSNNNYLTKAKQVLEIVAHTMHRFPQASSASLLTMDWLTDNVSELVAVTKSEFDRSRLLEFFPNLVLAHGNKDSKLELAKSQYESKGPETFYVCQNKTCDLPETDIGKVRDKLSQHIPYTL